MALVTVTCTTPTASKKPAVGRAQSLKIRRIGCWVIGGVQEVSSAPFRHHACSNGLRETSRRHVHQLLIE